MDAESAFAKMRQNEELKKEVNPFDENDKELRPFYRGLLIYDDGKKVEYFRLLNLNLFVGKFFTPSNIAMADNGRFVKFEVKDTEKWKTTVNTLSYTKAEKWSYEGLEYGVESDKIKYESLNARQYGDPHEDMEE